MASTQKLFEVTYHDDDDTGMYHVGEVDFGISGTLDDYLRTFGLSGKIDLINTLGYLIYEIERKFREQQLSGSTQLQGQSQPS